MRITFVAMGWENISIEYLSAYLKKNGHETSLAYDQCLFDDKNYVAIPSLAKLFNNSHSVIEQIMESKPDLICFSVMTVMYTWALNLAQIVKEQCDIPILFGGYHPTGAPETVIKEEAVDMVIVGEGENALLNLCNSMEKKEERTDIRGVWFKDAYGNIIRNPNAAPVQNIDDLPFIDKDIFAPHVPLKTYYLSSLARGCIYNCTYCAVTIQNTISREAGIKMFRLHSVDRAIAELKHFKEKYKYKWVDFRHAIFSGNPKWIIDFCKKYKKEIGVPFRIFMHPKVIRDDTTRALVEAGCFTIQMGLESFDEKLRREALNRRETNEEIYKAIDIMEQNKCPYTLDYILGLPGQTEKELFNIANYFAGLKYCYRLSPFMCQYLPGSEMVDYAVKIGELSPANVKEIDDGIHDNYMAEGSIAVYSTEKQKMLRMYRTLYRAMGLVPWYIRKIVMKTKVYAVLRYLPAKIVTSIVKLLDVVIVIQDRDARSYLYNYIWWMTRRLIPGHPTFIFRRSRYKKRYGSINLLYMKPKPANRYRCPTPVERRAS